MYVDYFDVVDVERPHTSTSRTAADERLSSEEVQVERVSVAEISNILGKFYRFVNKRLSFSSNNCP